jgi:WD40 repeat protein
MRKSFWASFLFSIVLALPLFLAEQNHNCRGESADNRLPPGACARLGSLRFRHGALVECLAFSPDGKRLVSGGPNQVRIWQSEDGQLVNSTFEKDPRTTGKIAVAVAYSPDGRLLAIAHAAIDLWDAASGRMLQSIRLVDGSFSIYSIAFSPDGSTLAIGGSGKEILLWSLVEKKVIRKYKGNRDWVRCVAVSPDGKLLASGGADRSVRIWHVESGKLLHVLTDRYEEFSTVVFSPDGRFVASPEKDRTASIWETATGRLHLKTEPHEGAIASIAFSPDSRMFACAGALEAIFVREIRSGKVLRTIPTRSFPYALVFSPDGKTIAWSSHQSVQLCRLGLQNETLAVPGHIHEVTGVGFLPDGVTIVTASKDRTIRFWDLKTKKETRCLKQYGSLAATSFSSVAISNDGKTIASNAGSYRDIILWNVQFGEVLHFVFDDRTDVDRAFCISPDNRTLATGGTTGTIRFWDVKTGKLAGELRGHAHEIKGLAYFPDGKRLVSASEDKTVRVWNLLSGKEVLRIHGEGMKMTSEGQYFAVAVAPNGKLIAARTYNGDVQVWDGDSGKQLHYFNETGTQAYHHERGTICIAFAPNGKLLASGGADSSIRLWDLETGKLKQKLVGHEWGIHCIAFSPDGKLLASASADTTTLVWNLEDVNR